MNNIFSLAVKSVHLRIWNFTMSVWVGSIAQTPTLNSSSQSRKQCNSYPSWSPPMWAKLSTDPQRVNRKAKILGKLTTAIILCDGVGNYWDSPRTSGLNGGVSLIDWALYKDTASTGVSKSGSTRKPPWELTLASQCAFWGMLVGTKTPEHRLTSDSNARFLFGDHRL